MCFSFLPALSYLTIKRNNVDLLNHKLEEGVVAKKICFLIKKRWYIEEEKKYRALITKKKNLES